MENRGARDDFARDTLPAMIPITESELRYFSLAAREGVSLARRKRQTYWYMSEEGKGIFGLMRMGAKSHTFRLRGMYVVPEYRGQGIGLKMIQEAVQIGLGDLGALSISGIFLPPSARLAERVGFQVKRLSKKGHPIMEMKLPRQLEIPNAP